MAARSSALEVAGGSDAAVAAQQENVRFARDAKMASAKRILSDVAQTIENNKLRIALTELNTRGHLQALITELGLEDRVHLLGEVPDAVRLVAADRMLVETDAPYLAPVPHRGKRNEPAYVAEVAHRLAEWRF